MANRRASDLVVLITGATSGLGKALAETAGRAGASLALCGRSKDKLETLLREFEAMAIPGKIHAETFDATDASRVGVFVERSLAALGRIDVLINCAGANSARGPVASLATGKLEAMMALNCYSPLFFIQACHAAMAARGEGLVLNILSTCCRFSNEGLGAYTASKTAFEGLIGVYRKEARKEGIRVSSVYPGGIDTPFRAQARPEYLRPEAAAEAVFSLALLDPSVAPDEFVLRPFVETNYA